MKLHNLNRIDGLILTLVCIFSAISVSFAQQKGDLIVGRQYHDLKWENFVRQIENDFHIKFFYQPDSLPDFRIKILQSSLTLQEVLRQNFKPLGFQVENDGSGNYFIFNGQPMQTSFADDFFVVRDTLKVETVQLQNQQDEKQEGQYLNTFSDYITKTVIIGSKRQGFNLVKATVSGYVTGSENGKPIGQAMVKVEETGNHAATDDQGFYSLSEKKGKYTLVVNSMGRFEKKYRIELLSDGKLDINLDAQAFMLEEAVITSNRHHNVKSTQMGVEKLNAMIINEIPAVMGEKDLIKVALLLPGIQTVGEVSSGFNVRGSPADQNLFSINQVPIYNVSHLFGFFSAFNTDAINDFDVYKSSIPAMYGGRLSSIFDISARQGNAGKFSARGGISPVTARMVAEGPIIRNKSSYLVGFRSTYSDWVLKNIKDPDIHNSQANFADAVANFSFTLDKNNQLKVFTYGSRDYASLAIGTENRYSNAGASLIWQHRFSSKHSAAFSLASSNYFFEEINKEQVSTAYKQSFNLNHSEFRSDFNLALNEKHTIKYGLNAVLYHLKQGDFLPYNDESLVMRKSFESEQGLESGLYAADDFMVTRNFEISAGIRWNMFGYFGPKTVFSYQEGLPVISENISDTTIYKNNSLIKNYTNVDLRLSAKYMITEDMSAKISYNRLHQHLFLLSNTITISPTDKWKLCDSHLKPMAGDQFSVGWYKNFLGNSLEASVEAYYKKVTNQVDYKDGANFRINEIPETGIIQGELSAWGIEFMLKKKIGNFNGWINYTWSRAIILAKNEATGESNNFGKRYPANHDKPHALNLVLNYKLTKRLSFSGNMVYNSGRPVTYPTAIYYQNGIEVTQFSARNEYRLPGYFRVDLSVNVEGNLKKKKFAHGSWTFSVYNLLGRNNVYSVYFRNENGNITGYKLAIFGSMIPSVTYNFKLGNYAD